MSVPLRLSDGASLLCCMAFIVLDYKGMGAPYYLISMMGGAAHLQWQLSSVKLDDPSSCMSRFVSNKWFGAIVLSGIIVDVYWRRSKEKERLSDTNKSIKSSKAKKQLQA
jgi:4-hydroxybenzoate polyprenyltransferase